MRGTDRAALATIDGDGTPFASLVLAACDHDGTPILLVSALARHTRNLDAVPRASLLFDGTAGHDDPLEGPRVTLTGVVEASGDPAHRDRYLARHPSAGGYAGFGDFRLCVLRPGQAYLVAGFGRIHRIPADALLAPARTARDFAGAEPELLAQLNDGALGVPVSGTPAGDGGWRATGIDCDGIDLRLGARTRRIAFPRPAAGPAEVPALMRDVLSTPPD